MALYKNGINLSEKGISELLGITQRKGTTMMKIKKLFNKRNFDTHYHYKIKNKKSALGKLADYLRNDFDIIAMVDRFVYDKKTPRIDAKTTWENKRHSFHFVTIRDVDDRFVHFNDPHEVVGQSKLPIGLFLIAWTKYFLALKKQNAGRIRKETRMEITAASEKMTKLK